MQLPNLQFIRSIPVWGPRLYEAFSAVQQQTTRIETQGNLNATGDPPVPPPPDALKVTNGPSGEYQIAITHNGQFNRGTSFHVQWDTSPHFTNPHSIDLGASRNDSSLNLPGQTAFFRASAASPSGANSAWTYHGTQNNPAPVVGGVRGVRAPGMGSGTGAPGDQSGGPGPIQHRNAQAGYNWTAQQRTSGAGFGSSVQGTPGGVGASAGSGGGGIVSALILVDTYANWTSTKYPPGNYPVGTLFVISNHNNVTYQVQVVSSANTWVYLDGTGPYAVAQSGVSGIKGYNGTALGTNDAGLLVNVTDYGHVLQWNGSAFGWGPGELGSGYFQDFAVAPTGSGWHACDGSAVHYLMATGALSSGTLTLPNTASSGAYRKLGSSYAGTITAAAAPTVTPTGTVSQPTFTGNASSSTNVLNTGGATAIVPAPFTPAGTVSQPTFTGASDTVSLAGGDPVANFQAIQYFRQ